MSNMKPSILINVDLTNPGQFFACCGLLELADRFDQNTLAHFDRGHFVVHADIHAVLGSFFRCNVKVDSPTTSQNGDEPDDVNEDENLDSHRGRTYPMTLLEPFNLRLDWWTDEEAQGQKLKTWTAGQRVTDLLVGFHKKRKRKGKNEPVYIPSMREQFAEAVKQCPDDWLREPRPIKEPASFSYDSRLSRNNALDQGFVGNSILAFSPAIEVLALVGLQRFRPRMLEKWTRNLYCVWNQPLPVEIAAVAVQGLIPSCVDSYFEFPVKRRDSQGRFKLFGHAQPVRSPNV